MDRVRIIKLLVAILGIIYVISPIDFIPDIIPIIGWIDDVMVIITALVVWIR